MSLKRWLLGALVGASFVVPAQARIQVQTPALLGPDAQTADSGVADCGVESMVSEFAVKVLRENIVGIQPATEAQRSTTDPYLRLTILWVHGAGGGSWSGPKDRKSVV